MRRTVLLIATMALLALSLGVGSAFAADQIIQCHHTPCYGTGNYDLIYERVGNGKNDTIILRGGNDRMLANAYTNDTDVVRGGTGLDRINVADGDTRDRAGGNDGGRDYCIVDSRAEVGSGCERVTVQ